MIVPIFIIQHNDNKRTLCLNTDERTVALHDFDKTRDANLVTKIAKTNITITPTKLSLDERINALKNMTITVTSL